eukprot:COSAG02_NODE_7189_length_3130_cov_2.998350_1_plen_140_part_00
MARFVPSVLDRSARYSSKVRARVLDRARAGGWRHLTTLTSEVLGGFEAPVPRLHPAAIEVESAVRMHRTRTTSHEPGRDARARSQQCARAPRHHQHQNYIICTQGPWAVPPSCEARRFFVLEHDEKWAGNQTVESVAHF